MASREARSDTARQIVEYVADFIERAGRFEGAGKARRLCLQDVLTFSTGEVTPAMDVMATAVRAMLSGEATYTTRGNPAYLPSTRAKRPSASEATS